MKDGTEIVVKYKEIKLNLTGFTSAYNKKTNELKMAWKIKSDTKQFLYYAPNDSYLEIIKPFLEQAKNQGYDVQNVKDNIINIYNEIPKDTLKKYQEENK